MAEKKSFLLYISDSPMWNLLNDEQAGVLIKALLQYAETGERIETADGMIMMAFMTFTAQMDRDAEKYEQKCERRREAGKKGGRPKKQEEPEEAPESEEGEEKANAFSGKQTKAKKANGFSEKQTKAKKTDAEEEEDADAEADAEEDEDAEEEERFPDASHHGGNTRARRATPGERSANGVFDSLWGQYPAEGQTRRDFVPDSCVQDCIENADDVRAAIEHYAAHVEATGKKLMSGCDFFRGAWRGFVDAAPPGRSRHSPAAGSREIVQTQSRESFTPEDIESLVNLF